MIATSMTLACPDNLLADANDLAMVLGEGPLDGQTFGAARWQTTHGARYALARFEPALRWDGAMSATLTRPDWDERPYTVNMAGAHRAQDSLLNGHGINLTATELPAGRILVLYGLTVTEVLAALSLTRHDATQL